ncbi:MAG TPA: gephyrin-like molybdotransferase Glp [Rhodopila sp.]|uniref:molybdopterin molybdotransferase MoeA n=1 Tax=Rhodopila sp. TaxID=2480087 RepID=UPI002C418571|nr:gephyrin-like molybdotransferase Glp [Rhodopila sp.]HVY18384.1 gephyrin-like molybdotransferase Glp [Rhodopila sp.]
MNAIAPAFGCTAGGLPFEDALHHVLALVTAPLPAERVPFAACVGRVLAQPVHARLDLPGFDQSAMDGYAVRAIDAMPGARLPVTGRTAAGEPPHHLVPGGAHRIFTGAPLPWGADAVIAQENLHRDGDVVAIAATPPAGTNLRRRGEDIRAGTVLIPAGITLDWRHLTVLAAQGIGTVEVRRRPRVTLLSSGRELRDVGESLAPGQIHDSNLPMLTALLAAWGAEVRPLPVVSDNAAAIGTALREASLAADLVLTTAGISVGEEDHVRDALRGHGGTLAVLKVAMKPGKPLAAGRLGQAVFLGLPGNPQAALAGAVGFLRPLLARLTGASSPATLRARADFSLRRKPGRTEFIPVRLAQHDTCLRATRAGPEGSGRLTPLLAADGLAMLAAWMGDLQQGDILDVHPWLPNGFAADWPHR